MSTVIELREIPEVRRLIGAWRREGASVGLVMTMGALHRGHMSLVEYARTHSDRVLATIFVNPLQFGPSEDYVMYPRTEARDSELLEGWGCEALFAPPVEVIFPRGERSPEESRTLVNVRGATAILDGPVRPGHFVGMASIVMKMLNIVAPDEAYFGEKDYQQYVIIRAMADDLCVPVRIVLCPTIRESDGLAMSSRNAYLSDEQRAIAPGLYQTMRTAANELCQEGVQRAGAVAERAKVRLITLGFESVDYLEFRDDQLALPDPGADARDLRLIAAAWLGRAQLTDNVLVAEALTALRQRRGHCPADQPIQQPVVQSAEYLNVLVHSDENFALSKGRADQARRDNAVRPAVGMLDVTLVVTDEELHLGIL
jgi:pantoate--beta-alanine ligase